ARSRRAGTGTQDGEQANDRCIFAREKAGRHGEHSMIVQELHAVQERCGYLPEAELRALAERLRVPLHRLHEVASFYPLYRLVPGSPAEVKVCRDMACHLHGAPRLQGDLTALGSEIGGGKVTVDGVSCLGQCDRPVAVSINDHVYRGLPEDRLRA